MSRDLTRGDDDPDLPSGAAAVYCLLGAVVAVLLVLGVALLVTVPR